MSIFKKNKKQANQDIIDSQRQEVMKNGKHIQLRIKHIEERVGDFMNEEGDISNYFEGIKEGFDSASLQVGTINENIDSTHKNFQEFHTYAS